jgi:hypothetical protein
VVAFSSSLFSSRSLTIPAIHISCTPVALVTYLRACFSSLT